MTTPFKYHERATSYERMYGFVNVTDKTVLDIGADWGSTPHFFITKGAKSVIAVDGDKGYYDRMVENLKDELRVLPVYLFIRKPQDMAELIETYRPDVVKIDCEGCEIHLASVSLDILKIPQEYVIETHGDEILDSINNAMSAAGFVLKAEGKRGFRNTGVQYYAR